MKPKVSIVLATYNGEKFVAQAIASVLWQTMPEFELIIVDDKSTDKTAEIIQKFASTDTRIKFIGLETNSGGPALPRTLGCRVARGEYVAFCDQDDLFYPDYLRIKLDFFLSHPNVNYLKSLAWTFDPQKKSIINYEYGGPVGMMLRRDILESIGYFDPEISGVDEVGMWYQYKIRYGNDGCVDVGGEPIALYARHAEQASFVENKNTLAIAERLRRLVEEKNLISVQKDEEIIRAATYLLSRIGNLLCLANKMKEGRVYFLKSLRLRINLFSFLFFWISFFGQKFYWGIESFLRWLQREIIWRTRTFIKSLEYPKSYAMAKKILADYDNFASGQ